MLLCSDELSNFTLIVVFLVCLISFLYFLLIYMVSSVHACLIPFSMNIIADYPYVRGKPVVTTNYNSTTQEFHFLCEFFISQRVGVTYFVEWVHNMQMVLKGSVDEFGQNSTAVSLNVREIQDFTFRSNVRYANEPH